MEDARNCGWEEIARNRINWPNLTLKKKKKRGPKHSVNMWMLLHNRIPVATILVQFKQVLIQYARYVRLHKQL